MYITGVTSRPSSVDDTRPPSTMRRVFGLPSIKKITAIKLEALPHESLPALFGTKAGFSEDAFLVEGVRRVNVLVDEISNGAREQLSGISQINAASAQPNAATARSM